MLRQHLLLRATDSKWFLILRFNTVAKTYLKKGLVNASQSLQAIDPLSSKGRSRHTYHDWLIDAVSTTCGGDVRLGLNQLHLHWRAQHITRNVALVSGKDEFLLWFHVVGKILHCKRQVDKRTLNLSSSSAKRKPFASYDLIDHEGISISSPKKRKLVDSILQATPSIVGLPWDISDAWLTPEQDKKTKQPLFIDLISDDEETVNVGGASGDIMKPRSPLSTSGSPISFNSNLPAITEQIISGKALKLHSNENNTLDFAATHLTPAQTRFPLDFDVKEFINSIPNQSQDTLTLYLHENYTSFVRSVEQAGSLLDLWSCCDENRWWSQDDISMTMIVFGSLYHLDRYHVEEYEFLESRPSSVGFRPIRAPAFFKHRRRTMKVNQCYRDGIATGKVCLLDGTINTSIW